ncbi:cilia-and flagella-associated protein 96-like [Onthophagus taurus]|uniref:cilia-and flagella-associated protein 96-like n=1 Tax=Onthophagus taurus TaxID=166361 RepID=UPI000C2020D1|nr:UPF0602 protein C4orf47-like [Onthophagus taurus]
MPIIFDDTNLGAAFGKPDLERIGVFIDDGHLSVKYAAQGANYFKGKNMYPGGRKLKNGTTHGYFDTEFRRIYEGEGVNWQKKKEKGGKPQKTLIFAPVGPAKLHSTPNDYFGCFTKGAEYFSGVEKPKPKYVHEKGNFTTRPGKKGGFGYADICLSKYPEHVPDPYTPKPKKEKKDKTGKKGPSPPLILKIQPKPYFDPNPFVDPSGKIGPTYVKPKEKIIPFRSNCWMPNGPSKWQGGMHAGCFSPFPEWIAPKKDKKQPKRRKQAPEVFVFYPQSMALKTMYTTPIIPKHMDINICQDNYHTYEATYVKHLLDNNIVL